MPKFLNISDIRTYSVESQYYFLDANVWIYAFHDFDSLKNYQQPYSNLFYDIFDNENSTASVIVCSLLISEIINTYMKVIAINKLRLEEYNGHLPNKFDFKRDYRNKHRNHFEEHFKIIKDDISALVKNDKKTLILEDKGRELILKKNVIENCPVNFDFNDYYYYALLKAFKTTGKISIVTNDSDWQIEDLEIITSEKTLLDLRTYI